MLDDNKRTLNNVTGRSDVFKDAGQRQFGTLSASNSKLTIQDMVNSSKRDNGGFGIDGKIKVLMIIRLCNSNKLCSL